MFNKVPAWLAYVLYGVAIVVSLAIAGVLIGMATQVGITKEEIAANYQALSITAIVVAGVVTLGGIAWAVVGIMSRSAHESEQKEVSNTYNRSSKR